jgi:hypothetical protein
MIDQLAIKFSRGAIVALISAAWLTESPALLAVTAAVLLAATLWPEANLFALLYRHVVKPLKLLTPNPTPDTDSPHRFTRGFAAVCLSASWVAHLAGAPTVGWAVALLVMALSLLALVANICVGCQVYYLLGRLAAIRGGRSAGTPPAAL